MRRTASLLYPPSPGPSLADEEEERAETYAHLPDPSSHPVSKGGQTGRVSHIMPSHPRLGGRGQDRQGLNPARSAASTSRCTPLPVQASPLWAGGRGAIFRSSPCPRGGRACEPSATCIRSWIMAPTLSADWCRPGKDCSQPVVIGFAYAVLVDKQFRPHPLPWALSSQMLSARRGRAWKRCGEAR